MARPSLALQQWFAGSGRKKLSFSDLWKVVLIRVADRAADQVDEEGETIGGRDWWTYAYDVASIADNDGIAAYPGDLQRVSLYLEQHGWIDLARRQPIKAMLTANGKAKAEELLNEILNAPSAEQSAYKFYDNDKNIEDWLLMNGYHDHPSDIPAKDAAVNFRKIADGFVRKIADKKLDNIIDKLERQFLLFPDVDRRRFHALITPAGARYALLLRESSSTALSPASNRFVRLDDNSLQYPDAVKHLEELIGEANKIRINDWPEKEGVIASLKSALAMIQTRYVNKQAVLAAVSGATAFILIKFAEAPISDFANRAWDAVKALF